MSAFNLNSKDIISICVDDISGYDYRGRIYSCYTGGFAPYTGVVDIINIITALLDETNHPQGSVRYRSFSKKSPKPVIKRSELTMKTTPGEVSSQKGAKCTFILRVENRQNASWQGSVTWTERSISKPFRSALELIKLIDGALEQAGEYSAPNSETSELVMEIDD